MCPDFPTAKISVCAGCEKRPINKNVAIILTLIVIRMPLLTGLTRSVSPTDLLPSVIPIQITDSRLLAGACTKRGQHRLRYRRYGRCSDWAEHRRTDRPKID
jgi:hypothetical protein